MKKHAVLVNTSRGTLGRSDALALALRKEWIWGAGLDVVEGEPHIDADHPLMKEPMSVCAFSSSWFCCFFWLLGGVSLKEKKTYFAMSADA